MLNRAAKQANSRQVQSNQRHLHPNLYKIVDRHLNTHYRATVAGHNLRAYHRLQEQALCDGRPLILDSFCGTGRSTQLLATRFPEHFVVGIDRSAHRLSKHGPVQLDNYLLLRAECEPVWQLLAENQIRLSHHYLLYPNPWPKSGHLQRRIHGHANFPQLLALGGKLELRSNWQIYVEEFGAAMHHAGQRGVVARLGENEHPLTLFEKKYRDSGHPIWSYRCLIAP
ncbi:MAG: hypothetical protein Hals2KO_26210 [Halioglobus sp.]